MPRIERAVREILLAIGEDPDRGSLQETPARVARMYAELFAGLRDDPARLRKHARHLGADGHSWRLVRIEEPAELKAVLAAFGIVAIPDGAGGFEHNAAIHLVGRDGRLSDIADYDKPASAVAKLRSQL